MLKKNLSIVTLLLVIGISPRVGLADARLLRTTYALDDARGYCIDIAGFGENIRLEDRLQVHTCKYGTPLGDQLFERVAGKSQLRAPEYGVCLEAASLESGAELLDVEFTQFHPTGMVWPPSVSGTLVTEGVRGDGGRGDRPVGDGGTPRSRPPFPHRHPRRG